jgi:orotate phosphoribosyltransferase
MKQSKAIARKLLEIRAVRLSPKQPFTWASGILSPIYCDNRLLLSHPSIRDFTTNGFVELSAQFGDFDVIAGVATAGIPHGVLLADRLHKPFVYVREKAKAHGRQNQIEGSLPENARVLVVEDLISTGGSSLKAVEALKEANVQVVGTAAIFTYGFERATNAFSKANCLLKTLTDYDTLLEVAAEMGYVQPEDLKILSKWRISPENWI